MKTLFQIILTFLFCTRLDAQIPGVQSILDEVNLDSLVHSVEQLSGQKQVIVNGSAQTIQSRQHQKTGNELAYQFLKAEFTRHGYQIDSMRFSPTGKNLYAIKPGYLYPNRWFMLGAHYDNLPLAIVAPGADDNASGCAAVLEAGRILADYTFPYTIVFALWDEEEPGLIGSTAHAGKVGSKNETLVGYLNLDMIGWDGNNDSIADIHVKPIKNSEALAQKTVYCNDRYTIGINLNIVNPGIYNSDQIPFWNKGHSAIAINEHNVYDLNPHLHKVSDVIDHFNMDYFLRMSKLAIATISELALDTDYDYGFGEADDELHLFPNPFSTRISIRLDDAKDHITSIHLMDCTGKKVLETESDNTSPIITLNGEQLNTGVYFIRVFSVERSYIRRIVKF